VDDVILIREDGSLSFVYSDEVAGLFAGEAQATRRASHVEPMATYGFEGTGWLADMRPSGGPILLGPHGRGYLTREAALDAERVWLREEKGL